MNGNSDNFVKRNLKRRGGAVKYKKTSHKHSKASSSSSSSSYRYPQQKGQEEEEGGHQAAGLSGWGLDPLALSLDHLTSRPPPPPPPPPPAPAPSASAPRLPQRAIRGLDLSQRSSSSSCFSPASLSAASLLLDCAWSRRASHALVDRLEREAPRCPGHGLPARLFVVRKAGSRWPGRRFYGCAFPADQRCGFFLWAEDNPALLDGVAEESSSSVSAVEAFAWQSYGQRLAVLAKEGLVREALAFRRRRQANGVEGSGQRLRVCGSRATLEAILLEEARWWIAQTASRYRPPPPPAPPPPPPPPLVTTVMAGAPNVSHSPLARSKEEEEEEEVIYLSDSESEEESRDPRATPSQQPNTNIDANNNNKDDQQLELKEEEEEIFLSDSSEGSGDDSQSINSDQEDDEELLQEEEEEECVSSSGSREVSEVVKWFFGFSGLKAMQREVIERVVLQRRSTLAVLPTGAGKSLCYQTSAALLPGLTLVLTPLLALQQDQASRLPCDLPHLVLDSSLGALQTLRLAQQVMAAGGGGEGGGGGGVKVVFLSPERFVSRPFLLLLRRLGRSAVSLVCIDEAHCLSQWSHLFRPAYLLLRQVLREEVALCGATVLALTATAGQSVQRDVCEALGIAYPSDRLWDRSPRENISIRCELIADAAGGGGAGAGGVWEANADDGGGGGDPRRRLFDVLTESFLTPPPPAAAPPPPPRSSASKQQDVSLQCNSIVYVSRRRDCDLVHEYLSRFRGLRGVLVYHAGLAGRERERAQRRFTSSSSTTTSSSSSPYQCIIATVAFGMGVDKADVHQVVHWALPRSLEAFLQEIGRAGRDKHTTRARAICFFSQRDGQQQFNLAYKVSVSTLQLLGLLRALLPPDTRPSSSSSSCSSSSSSSTSSLTHALVLDEALRRYDASPALVETVACLLREEVEVEALRELEAVTVRWRLPIQQLRDKAAAAQRKNRADELLAVLVRLYLQQEESQSTSGGKACGGGGGGPRSLLSDSSNAYQTCQSFRTSRCELARLCAISRDEVGPLLFALQQRGVLAYRLHSPALVYSVLLPSSSSHSLSLQSYEQWLLDTARRVGRQLQSLLDREANRVEEMYRLAHTVHTLQRREKPSGGPEVTTIDIQHFVQVLLDRDGDQSSPPPPPPPPPCDGLALHRLAEQYASCPPLFSSAEGIREEVRGFVRRLSQDRQLLRLCGHFAAALVGLSKETAWLEGFAAAKREALALCICRVLMALPSPLLFLYPTRSVEKADQSDEELPDEQEEEEERVAVCIELNHLLREHYGKLKDRIAFNTLREHVLLALSELYGSNR